ncbi:MAG: phosphoribosylanthranilate isomerase [Planctomycetota bacterium]
MPTRTRIKICGLSTLATARAAVDAGADAVGFVFAEGSPRLVDPGKAAMIVSKLPAFVEPVGLFVNTPVNQIAAIADQTRITTVQLHGDEGPDAALQLSRRFRVVKALPHDAKLIDRWRGISHCVALLIDAPRVKGELTGGTGRTHDYSALGAMDRTGLPPIILAGGLTPDNVAGAIAAAKPYGVDVSSGVEFPDRPGEKDVDRITAFCAAVRSIE